MSDQVLILRDGSNELIDESLLIKREYVAEEDDDKRVDVLEYCLVGCAGKAHQIFAGGTEMCLFHVHRSVHVTMKRWPQGMEGVMSGFGG